MLLHCLDTLIAGLKGHFFGFIVAVFFHRELDALDLIGFGAPTGLPKRVTSPAAMVEDAAHAGVFLAPHHSQFLPAQPRVFFFQLAGGLRRRLFGRSLGGKLTVVENAIDPLASPIEPDNISDLSMFGIIHLKEKRHIGPLNAFFFHKFDC